MKNVSKFYLCSLEQKVKKVKYQTSSNDLEWNSDAFEPRFIRRKQ